MSGDEKRDDLERIISFYEKSMPDRIEGLSSGRRRKFQRGAVLSSVSRYHKAIGVRSYFIDNDASGFKQNYFLSTKLALASAGEPGGRSFETGSIIQEALLSDNEVVVRDILAIKEQKFARYKENPLSEDFHLYMIHLAIRGEDEQIEKMIVKIAKNGKNPLRAECAGGRDFYSLLLKGSRAELETLIQSRDASIKSADPIDEDFISYLGALETKLCWRRGIQVEIDHPLVPMELMPVKPLDHYDDVYDFLKPGWVPPTQGLIGRVSRWFKT
ncbi:Imm49 family immunity protein [Burkholderia sp. Se-20373]|uniref:Imm49 family immunity protein n=1 Tax=Burkholderia sp. Se-20373 TaxID=2703898 RepID=UPI001F11DFAD|nr:Imm49 family immunity protein [Burkholderia sp. Se-20373]